MSIDKSMRPQTACFSGHRPSGLGGFDELNPLNVAVKDALRVMIELAIETGTTRFITGMALGVDTWAAEIAIEYPNVELIAAVPFEGQERRWPEHSQKRYRSLLKKSAHVEVVSSEKTLKAFFIRNEWMVDRSSLMLAVWNGAGRSGTASAIRYAIREDIEVIGYEPKLNAFFDTHDAARRLGETKA